MSEEEFLKNYDSSKYEKPSVTVDLMVLKEEEILLIKRKNYPFKDCWALPGGFVDINESLNDAAKRELKEETNLEAIDLFQVGAFGEVDRDPRMRVISVAYIAKVKGKEKAGDDAKNLKWFPINNLPDLAFDHKRIIKEGLKYVSSN